MGCINQIRIFQLVENMLGTVCGRNTVSASDIDIANSIIQDVLVAFVKAFLMPIPEGLPRLARFARSDVGICRSHWPWRGQFGYV